MGQEQRNFNINFYIETCCNCGMLFAIPLTLANRLSNEDCGKTFYCPMGHPQHYLGKSDAQKAREAEAALKKEQKRRQWAEQDAQRARDAASRAEYSRRAEKAAKTRLKNRISKGVCPCCNRTFQDLGRHMATKHPEYS